MTRRCNNCTGIRSPTASPSGPTKAARCSPKAPTVGTLQSLPPLEEPKAGSSRVAKVAGFSLHAGVEAEAHQRDKLERLCRYIARPAVSEKRLSLLDGGRIRSELKTPYGDGTTHVAAPAHPAPAALVRPCTSSSSRWTFWPGLLRWFPNRGSTPDQVRGRL
jgi:hypothetical protein